MLCFLYLYFLLYYSYHAYTQLFVTFQSENIRHINTVGI